MGWLALTQFDIAVIIFLAVIGPAVGNYACSVIYRLPLGITPFERHPYCGSCGADLKPVDLFPILSWMGTKGRCRYCDCLVPSLYTWVEIACGAVFILYYLFYGLGDLFLLNTAYAVFVIILAGIQWREGWISSSIYGYAFTFAVLLATMFDGTIVFWVQGGFVMLVLAVSWQWLCCKITGREFRPFDAPWIWWMVLLAVQLPFDQWHLLYAPLVVLAGFRLMTQAARPWVLLPMTLIALAMPIFVF